MLLAAEMTFDQFTTLIRDFGTPIAVAAVLLWFFLHMSRSQADQQANLLNNASKQQGDLFNKLTSELAEQNKDLSEQVTRLAKNADALQHAMNVNERLMTQNERLVESIRSKEDAFIKLLQAINGGNSHIELGEAEAARKKGVQ